MTRFVVRVHAGEQNFLITTNLMDVSIEPIFLTTTKVDRLSGKVDSGSATGFFYTRNDKTYLITNKHVIYGDNFSDEGAEPQIDKVRLTLHATSSDLSQNTDHIIDLFDKEKPVWKEHKNKEVDIIAIPLELDRSKFHFVTVADDLIDADGLKIGFEKIFIMGYPLGWHDAQHNLPISRIGHLSSPFRVPFNGKPFMLGDVETHKGMSGSPVFMHLKDYVTIGEDGGLTTNLGASKFILLGVYSGQPLWRLPDTITNDIKSVPHSLSVIWFSTLLREII